MTKLHQTIELYISQVGSFLPLNQQDKSLILDELELEVKEAMSNQKGSPEEVFGSARQTAINIVKSNDKELVRASWLRRIVSYSIDTIMVIALASIAIGVPYLLLREVFDFESDPTSGWDYFYIAIFSLYGLLAYVLCFSLYFIPEKLYSQSPGKRLLGIQVLDVSGIKITWKQAIARNLVKYQLEFLWLDFLIGILMGDGFEKATDLVSKTIVVRV